MSLNAGAGAGSSCPDVAVERRLRVPTLFWSTGSKCDRRTPIPHSPRTPMRAVPVVCVCMPSCAPRRGARLFYP